MPEPRSDRVARMDAAASAGAAAVDRLVSFVAITRSMDAVKIRALHDWRLAWEVETGIPLRGSDGMAWRSLRAEVGQVFGVSEQRAGVLLHAVAHLIDRLPATMAAVEAGRFGLDHAVAIARPVHVLPEALLAEYEERVLPVAEGMPAGRRLETAAQQIADQLHPAGLAEQAVAAREDRRFWIEPAGAGMALLAAIVPAVAAVGAYACIDGQARALRAAGDERTLEQLRADVFVDLLADPGAVLPPIETDGVARLTPGAVRGVKAEVVVHIPASSVRAVEAGATPTEAGWLDGFGPLDPATAVATVGLGSTLRRALTDPITGTVREADATRYRIPEHLRFAAHLRDRTCRSPGCHRPAASCDLDHLQPWEEHGQTVLANLESLCRNHHLLKHDGTWTPAGDPNGTLTWTGPSGRTYAAPPPPPRIPPPARPTDATGRVRSREMWSIEPADGDEAPF